MITAPGRTRQRRAWHLATRSLSASTSQKSSLPILEDSTKSMSSLRVTIGARTGLKRRYARSEEFAQIMRDIAADLARCNIIATGELLSQCGNWVYVISLSSPRAYHWDMISDLFAAHLLARPEHHGTSPRGLDELTVEELGQGVWSHLGSGSTAHMLDNHVGKLRNTGSTPSRTRSVDGRPTVEEIDRPEATSCGDRSVVRGGESDDEYAARTRAASRYSD